MLSSDYYFILYDGTMKKLTQSNDTLFEYKCFTDRPCFKELVTSYKIIDIKKNQSTLVLKLECLDTLQFPKVYPENRYSVMTFRVIDSNRISFIQQLNRLTINEITSNYRDTLKVNNKFGFTYYNTSYINYLNQLKPITTKKEIEEIINEFKSDEFKSIIEMYKLSYHTDLYASGLKSELFCLSSIKKGFNPILPSKTAYELLR